MPTEEEKIRAEQETLKYLVEKLKAKVTKQPYRYRGSTYIETDKGLVLITINEDHVVETRAREFANKKLPQRAEVDFREVGKPQVKIFNIPQKGPKRIDRP